MRLRYSLLLLGLMVLAGVCGGVVAAPARAAAVTYYVVASDGVPIPGDGTPPTTLLSSSPAAPNGDSQWFRGAAPLVTLTASDPEGSATTTYYSWDTDPGVPGQGWSLYGGTLTVPSNVHTLYFYSSDVAGNVESTRSQVFKVDSDTTAPTVTTPTGAESTPTPVRGTIDCDSTASDDLSGVDFVSFWLFDQSGGGWNGVGTQVGTDQTMPFTGTTYRVSWDTSGVRDGRYRLQSQLRDVAGNTAWSEPYYILVDNNGPTAAITKPGAGGAIGGSYAITGTADDPNLAGWTLQMREVGAGSWNTVASGSSSVVGGTRSMLDTVGYPLGSYQLQLVATDIAGNTSTDLVTPFMIDNAKPTVVSATAAGRTVVDVLFSEDLAPGSIARAHFAIPGLTVTAATLQADNRTVALSMSDQTSGASYTVSVAGGSSTITDLAGNIVGPLNTAAFTGSSVDSTPPTIPTGVTATSGYNKNQIAWTAVLDPDVAGYNVYRASSAGGVFTTPINAAPLTTMLFIDALYGPPGVYYYKVSAVDTAGNESEKSAAIAADTVNMSETVGPDGATLISSTGEVKIDIPAGALLGPVPIRVVEKPRPANMGQFTFASRAFEFLPAGQTFGSDVSITVAYDPSGLDETTMRLVCDKAGQWKFVEGGTTVDQVGDELTGRVKHFTDFAAASADVTPPTISSVTPADAATGVSVADFVTVVFSEPMDPSTLNTSTMQIRTGGVAGTPISLETVVFSADKKTAYLYPDRMLDINTTYGVWVSRVGVTDLAGNPLGTDSSTDFTSPFTTASSGMSPHDGYADSTDLCRNCHAVHGAAGPTLFVEVGEKQVCYTCHDGTGSSYNVKTTDNTSSPYSWDFGEDTIGSTSKISYHPVPKASTTAPVTGVTMLCSNCHNAHSMTGTGARFLAPKGLDPNPANRGPYAAQTGNAFCFTCHNTSAGTSADYISPASWDKSTGFDHKTYYPTDDSGHNKSTGSLVMAENPTVPSKENIACKGCHSEHGTTNDKLIAEKVNGQAVVFTVGSINTSYNLLCQACHSTSGLGGFSWTGNQSYNASGHGGVGGSVPTMDLSYKPPVPAVTQTLKTNVCKQCHEPHGAGDANGAFPNLTRYFEEDVCYVCHDTTGNPNSAAKNMATVFTRSAGDTVVGSVNAHNLTLSESTDRRHDLDKEYAATPSETGNTNLSGTKRHVECADCHNTHSSTNSTRMSPTNAVSGSLAGVWGVQPTNGASWTEPSTWTWSLGNRVYPAEYEYQICLKCHSANAYGATPPTVINPVVAIFDTSSSIDGGYVNFWTNELNRYTDQAKEFNPSNESYHAVWGNSKASGSGDYVPPWTSTSKMYCTDCHESVAAGVGDPKGPHGSTDYWILKGIWRTGTKGQKGNAMGNGTNAELCKGCHDFTFTNTGFKGPAPAGKNLHTNGHNGFNCTACHSAVPHGWQRDHLLVYGRGTPDPAPYNDHTSGAYGLPSGMTWANSGEWLKEDCSGSGTACHESPPLPQP